jgi:hypothetical protein
MHDTPPTDGVRLRLWSAIAATAIVLLLNALLGTV